MPTPFDTYRDTRHFACLDGLRFFCIVAVLWHHAPVWSALDDAPRLVARGFLGVDFFFVLSGYLITMLLLREEDRSGTISISEFYWRRILRIAPPFLATILVVVFFWVVLKGRYDYLALVPYYLFFLSNFLSEDIPFLTVTWSLAVEEQFYLVWPAIMLLTLGAVRKRVALLAVLIAGNVVAITALSAASAPAIGPLTLKLPNATYAPLLIGALLAVLLHRRRSFDFLHAALGARASAPVLVAALVVVLVVLPADLRGWPNLVVHLLMAGLLGALVVSPATPLHFVLTSRPLARIGVVSYGIYLYHLLALHVANEAMDAFGLGNPWIALAGMTGLSILMAEISYETLERHFRQMRHAPPIWARWRPAAAARLAPETK